MDLTKVSPAPWFADESYLVCGTDRNAPEMAKFNGPVFAPGDRNMNCAFAALARNVFEVKVRHPTWTAMPCINSRLDDRKTYWRIEDFENDCIVGTPAEVSDDWFTAFDKADKWYKENIEAKND